MFINIIFHNIKKSSFQISLEHIMVKKSKLGRRSFHQQAAVMVRNLEPY